MPTFRIDIESNNQFGRPRRFIITDTRGNRYSLNSEDFRHAVNTDATDHVTLGSSFCKPVNDPTQIRFTEGHGFGHGVGSANGAPNTKRHQACGMRRLCSARFRGRSWCGRINQDISRALAQSAWS